jgi:hypothetical protein
MITVTLKSGTSGAIADAVEALVNDAITRDVNLNGEEFGGVEVGDFTAVDVSGDAIKSAALYRQIVDLIDAR